MGEDRWREKGGDSGSVEILREVYNFLRIHRTSGNGLLLSDAGTAGGSIWKDAGGRKVFYKRGGRCLPAGQENGKEPVRLGGCIGA